MYIIVAEKNTSHVLYDVLNNYHSKIKLIIKTSPQRFLDTEIIYINDTIETPVHRKKTKTPIPWTSNIHKRYKKNPLRQNYIVLNEFHQTLQVR